MFPFARSGARGRRTARWAAAAAVGVAVLAAVAAGGGFDRVDRAAGADLPVLALDEVSVGRPWNVTVHGARLLADLEPGLYLTDPANHWFALILTLEVTGGASQWDVADAVRVTGVDGLVDAVAPHPLLVRDATRVDRLHPGLPEQVFLVWERSGDAPLDAVDVAVISRTLRPSSIGGNRAWFDPRPRARVRVPVVDQREAP